VYLIQPPPQVKPFDVATFLETVEGAGPHLTTGIKGNWNGLYRYTCQTSILVLVHIVLCRRFMASPNFTAWFSLRREEANQKLRLLHMDSLCKAVSYVKS